MERGKVFLVGAGPGDPKLITLKGIEAIAEADVIVYDRLAHPSLLSYAKDSVEKIYVGKSPNNHTLQQEEINQVLVEKALAGKVVTRLKGGDPNVFGRVGEEALELSKLNIPFEIIPGITSAIAVPAYAGIPVTHRGMASSFAIVTGHEDPSKNKTSINWRNISTATDTIIFLMGVANLQIIKENLVENGRSISTPVAVVQWGTRVEQRTVVGTLENIQMKVEEANITSPAIIIVGEVVNLREHLQWFEKKPFFGQRILVTRARSQASELSAWIRKLGGEPIEFPVIKTVPVQGKDMKKAVMELHSFDWVVFTSVNGVEAFFQELKIQKVDIRNLKGRIAAIGPKTAELLEEKGLIVEIVPEEYKAESLVESLKDQLKAGQRILLPRAEIARKVLPEKLRGMGLEVVEVDAYQTVIDAWNKEEIMELLREKRIDIITFTSSSTVKNFLASIEGEEIEKLIDHVKIASIGPITTETAENMGLKVDITANEYTINGLIKAITDFIND